MTKTFRCPSFGRLQSVLRPVVEAEAGPDSHWASGRVMYVHEQSVGLPDLLVAHTDKLYSSTRPVECGKVVLKAREELAVVSKDGRRAGRLELLSRTPMLSRSSLITSKRRWPR